MFPPEPPVALERHQNRAQTARARWEAREVYPCGRARFWYGLCADGRLRREQTRFPLVSLRAGVPVALSPCLPFPPLLSVLN